MKPRERRLNPFLYSPDARGFHIVLELRDTPGALVEVLQHLKPLVNLKDTQSYSTSEGKAIWSCFATALSPSVSEKTLELAVAKSSFVEGYDVKGTKGGLIFDTFHTGTDFGGTVPLVSISKKGLSMIFDDIVRTFGTGGDTLLYQQGRVLGRTAGKQLREFFGAKLMEDRVEDFAPIYSEMGWGRLTLSANRRREIFTARVEDCIMCSNGSEVASGCSFVRGHLVGLLSSMLRRGFEGEETKCVLKGDANCEFVLTRS